MDLLAELSASLDSGIPPRILVPCSSGPKLMVIVLDGARKTGHFNSFLGENLLLHFVEDVNEDDEWLDLSHLIERHLGEGLLLPVVCPPEFFIMGVR